jgi:hypothetical protein
MGTSFADHLAASKSADSPGDTAFRVEVAADLEDRLAREDIRRQLTADGAAFRQELTGLDTEGFIARTLEAIGGAAAPLADGDAERDDLRD